MLEWRLIERAHPDGIKKRRRTLIAALPRKRKEFLDRELARNPQLLDHEPRFLDDLAVLTEDYYPLTEEALSLVYHEGGLYAAPA